MLVCGCCAGVIGVRVRVRIRFDFIAGYRCSQTPTVIKNDNRAVATDRRDGRRRSAASDCGGRRCRRRRQRRYRLTGDSRWETRTRRRCRRRRHRLLYRHWSAASGGGTPRPRPPSWPSWTFRPRRLPRRRTSMIWGRLRLRTSSRDWISGPETLTIHIMT